jgi:eukaryotic-like serine/threonine-protein kinase
VTWVPDSVLRHLREVCETPDLSGTRYRLVGELGRGGMGVVYLVRDEELGREVALKVLDDPAEALLLAQLEHPGVVPVHDAGTLPDGRRFYTMKRVAGCRLREYAEQAHSLQERLQVFRRICDTVAFAHRQAVLHCDLKPDNIMVGPYGETLVMDWGLAQRAPAGAVESSPAGTPGYMAPEQQRGVFDARSDVFGLGGILRFLLPEGAPRRVRAIAAMALAEDPAARYPTVIDLRSDVVRYLEGLPVTAYPEGLLRKGARLLARHSTLALLVLTYLVVRALLFFWLGR